MPRSLIVRGCLSVALVLGVSACEKACGKAQEAAQFAADKAMSPQLERKLGDRLAAQVDRELPRLQNPQIQTYVDQLGTSLVARVEGAPQGTRFEFRVIDAPRTVNAMALPGGYIYVFSGLLHAVATEAELAGVLAHEIAHVAERHVAANLITRLGTEAVIALAVGGDAEVLAQAAARFAQQGALAAFSRSAEREADLLAIRYLARAGQDPRGYVTFFEKLARGGSTRDLAAKLLSTHPDPAERAATARTQIERLGQVPAPASSPAFDAMKAQLSR
jgi:beta-barrel assembly-enhancing protease